MTLFPSHNPQICIPGRTGIGYTGIDLYYQNKVRITKDGVKAFDFRRDFAIAAWVKIKRGHEMLSASIITTYRPSIEFRLSPQREQARRMKFRLRLISQDFSHNIIGSISTTDAYKDVYSWQHVAVVFKQPHDFKFYYNGEEWQLRRPVGERSFRFSDPRYLEFQYYSYESYGFIAMVQRSLSKVEINKLMTRLVL